jgi:hypothetical protein
MLDNVKARAAANPSAALAIGAGIGWKLVKHPPIATALIGAGVLSLWRTRPTRVENEDYLAAAQQRFGEQVRETADTVKEYTAETAAAVRRKVTAYAQSTWESAEELAAPTVQQAAETFDNAREAAANISDKVVPVAGRGSAHSSYAINDEDIRD